MVPAPRVTCTTTHRGTVCWTGSLPTAGGGPNGDDRRSPRRGTSCGWIATGEPTATWVPSCTAHPASGPASHWNRRTCCCEIGRASCREGGEWREVRE